jgi:predicted O-methyltransferase YrrM
MDLIPEMDQHLAAMEKKAKETMLPIVGPLVGRFLYLLTRLKQPNLVVELGSGFGYSAYWIARALSIRGKVVLTDYSEENIAYARQVMHETGLSDRAEFRAGDALQAGREYKDIDLLFIDLDKCQYLEAIEVMLPRLAQNALVIADNSLWYGKVAEEDTQDNETRAIRGFNDFMTSHRDFFTSIIPLRDGVLLAYKLN